jgi:type II secretory pathway predicted ATPase ExeA
VGVQSSYLEFYNLKEQPFSISVDDRFYFNSQQHARALMKLTHAVEQRKGLAVLVGETGTGKTTLARKMLEGLEESEYEAALLVVIHPSVTAEWILKKVATQMGVQNPHENRNDLVGQLYGRLMEIQDAGKKAVVLVDEAQMLQRREIMEELRGILNIEPDGVKLITFVLFGIPDLDSTLSSYKPLHQCIAVRCLLQPLSYDATQEYIQSRLSVAGSTRGLFSPDALDAIARYSGGIPRLINTICDNVLLEGFLSKQPLLDGAIVQSVVSDLQLTPLSDS